MVVVVVEVAERFMRRKNKRKIAPGKEFRRILGRLGKISKSVFVIDNIRKSV